MPKSEAKVKNDRFLKGAVARYRRHMNPRLGMYAFTYLVRGEGQRAVVVVNGYAQFEVWSRPAPSMSRQALSGYARIAHAHGWKVIVIYLDREINGFALTNMTGYLEHLRDPGYEGIYPARPKPKVTRVRIPLSQNATV